MPDVNMGSRESDYDPDQNPEEKRKIRMDYRKLHDGSCTALKSRTASTKRFIISFSERQCE